MKTIPPSLCYPTVVVMHALQIRSSVCLKFARKCLLPQPNCRRRQRPQIAKLRQVPCFVVVIGKPGPGHADSSYTRCLHEVPRWVAYFAQVVAQNSVKTVTQSRPMVLVVTIWLPPDTVLRRTTQLSLDRGSCPKYLQLESCL
jgi:hypothetical protein